MISHLQAIILAAGKSSRFNTGNTKLVEKLCGQEIILYQTRLFASLGIPTTVVVGHHKNILRNTITKEHGETITFVEQDSPKGAGHAILCARSHWKCDNVLITNGDTPLITPDIIEELYKKHIDTQASISFVTSHNSDPLSESYGRIVKDNHHVEVVHNKTFNDDPSHYCCVDAGIYIVTQKFLRKHTTDIDQSAPTSSFHVTDLIKMANSQKDTIATIAAPFDRIRGINTLQELWSAEQIKRSELIRHWMGQGIRFTSAQNIHLDLNVEIGAGSTIGSGVQLLGKTKIGSKTVVQPFSIIENSTIGNQSVIHSHSVVTNSTIGDHTQIGPFAHINDHNKIDAHAVIGNFVEIKRSKVGAHSKAKHLSYIGDTTIKDNVTIGAGTITCNYDGPEKRATTINDNVMIGSNTVIIAPITFGENSVTAAGSVITQDVPANALAIARSRQIIKKEYASLVKEKRQKKSAATLTQQKDF